MNKGTGINRRAFLGLASVCAALGAAGPARAFAALGVGAGALDGAQQARAQALAQLFAQPQSACRVGVAYLRAVPAEADPRLLLQAVCGDAPPDAPYALREAVACRIREDFAQGRLVKLDGWLLARTEGRLCALALLG